MRHRQIHVDDAGAVRAGDADTSEVLAEPGAVRRIVLAEADPIRPRLALLGDDGPIVVLALHRFLSSSTAMMDPDADLQVSGANAVAKALGLRIETAEPDLAHALAREDVVPPARPSAPGAVRRLILALVMLALFGVPALIALPLLAILIVVVAAALAARPVLTIDRCRREALGLMTSLPTDLPGLEGAHLLEPTHPEALSQRTVAGLLIGPRRIVEHHHGSESWFPGPAVDGVVSAEVQPERITLFDRDDLPMGSLEGGWATHPERFVEACTAAGIAVRLDPTPMAEVPGLGRLAPWRAGEGPGKGWALDVDEEGGISVLATSLVFGVLPFLSVVGLLCGVWQPWAVIVGLPGLVLSTIHVRGYLRIRRWKRGRLPATIGTVPAPRPRSHSPAQRPRQDAERPQPAWPSDAAVHQDSLGDLTFPGLACWLPVPLDLPGPAQTIDAVLGLVEHPAHDDRAVAEQIVPQVLAIAAATREDDPEDDVLSLAAWIHLEQDGRFTPDAVAWLRIIRGIGPGDDATTVLQMMTEGSGLLDVPTLTPLETGLGTAWSTVVRTRGADRQHPGHEESLVIWVVPDPGFALTLSVQAAEPALTPRISHQLVELAKIVALD